MFVYRICDEEEISSIIKNKSLTGIGHFYSTNPKKNTHSYYLGVKYLHFYEKYTDVFYLDSSKNCYICTYDIRDDILEKFSGVGYYLDRVFFNYLQEVHEYAVDVSFLSFQNLIQIDQIIAPISFEDIDYDFSDKIITIYSLDWNTYEDRKNYIKRR